MSFATDRSQLPSGGFGALFSSRTPDAMTDKEECRPDEYIGLLFLSLWSLSPSPQRKDLHHRSLGHWRLMKMRRVADKKEAVYF